MDPLDWLSKQTFPFDVPHNETCFTPFKCVIYYASFYSVLFMFPCLIESCLEILLYCHLMFIALNE